MWNNGKVKRYKPDIAEQKYKGKRVNSKKNYRCLECVEFLNYVVEMAKIVESIGKVGTITPLLARPLPDGGYELISGHRRLEACRKLGLENIPVIVREMTDDEAVIAKPRLHCAHRSRKAVCQSQRNQPCGKLSDRERRLAALYDSRLSPFCGEYSRRQRRTDSGHLRFARTRKRKHHRENLYQPSKDRKGDDDKRSRQRHKFEHRLKVV